MSLVVKNPPANAGDLRHTGSIPGSGRSPEEGKGYPLQYSGLENSMGSQRVRHNWVTLTFCPPHSNKGMLWKSTSHHATSELRLCLGSHLYRVEAKAFNSSQIPMPSWASQFHFHLIVLIFSLTLSSLLLFIHARLLSQGLCPGWVFHLEYFPSFICKSQSPLFQQGFPRQRDLSRLSYLHSLFHLPYCLLPLLWAYSRQQ